MCVSPPWDFRKAPRVFDVWSMLLVLPLKIYFLKHFYLLTHHSSFLADGGQSEKTNRRNSEILKGIGYWAIAMARNMKEFDSICYRLYDPSYRSVDCYYEAVSPCFRAHLITTPTLVVNAKDDPICCHTGCPTDPNLMGPGLIVVIYFIVYEMFEFFKTN
jgi:predicted alpha/beta-fold hydrolase